MPKKVATLPPSDPTLPTRTVPTAAGDIRLCIDFGVLMDAEEALMAAGQKDVNLLHSIHANTASSLRTFFVLASRRFHPELSIDEARKLVTPLNVSRISEVVSQLWVEVMPKHDESGDANADPTPAVK